MKRFLFIIQLTILLQITSITHVVKAQEPTKVFVLELKKEINAGTNRYVELGLKEAKRTNADLIIVDMNTYGGTVQDADEIVTRFLSYPTPVHVWINDKAYSAGALIAISCDSIYMSPGAVFGAATVVNQEGKPAPDKFQAGMRSKMRATAEAQGRNPQVAEGMVGRPVGTDSITVGGVISLTTDEAIAQGYCDGKVTSLDEILKKHLMLKKYSVSKFEEGLSEKIISFFLNPFLQTILIIIMIAGIYYELQAPGIGFPLLAAIIAAVLYFIPSYLTGLAEYWEILVFFAGIILIALEVLVIPGFGVAGISGLILLAAGIILVLLNNRYFDFSGVGENEIASAVTVTSVSIAAVIIAVVAGLPRLLKSKAFRKISLEEKFESSSGYTSATINPDLKGKEGISYTVLRPGGKIMIGDVLYDAASRGEYIEKGTPVVVLDVSGNTVRVKAIN
jgi:membrane-bound serine protease (ClpP class)